jgi:uncharacterized secreted protein with C-terminal beta-propeller domain
MRGAAKLATRSVVGVGAAGLLGGAFLLGPGGLGAPPAVAAGLTPFDGCTELRSWFADARRSYPATRGGLPAMEDADRTMTGAAGAAGASGALESHAVGPGATGTNVQEVGVDEPDVLKTQDGRVVVVREDRLHVIDVTGATPRKLGSVTLPGGTAHELLLSGERALVLGTSLGAANDGNEGGIEDGNKDGNTVPEDLVPPGQSAALLTVVDLATPTQPSVVRTHEIEGVYVSARQYDGVARVVLQSMPTFGLKGAAENWLPLHIERDAAGRISDTEPLLDCTDVRHPAEPSGVGLLTVLTVDFHNPDVLESVAVAADGDLVYSSTDRLYVATTRGGWIMREAMLFSAGSETDGVRTDIHAFDITDRTDTSYIASGDIEGWVLGRWAMSEYEGLLRVATTRGPQWNANGETPETDAAVTVFEERGDRLEPIGSVGGLGEGEQVRAVRWFGDVATVVTFRQTDPLYTVDLADPTQPRVLGELKVPGYSAYLHPLGDGLLLGVGQDATDDGRVLGTQVSTFDLSDLATPKALDTIVERRSYSEVEADSRQFTYLPDARTAVLPVMTDTGSTLWSLRVGDDGRLHENGRWFSRRTGQILRALPVDEARLAALHDATLTLLSVRELTELGSVRLT